MGPYLGDFKEDSTHYHSWDTNDSVGASVTRTVDGAIWTYKDDAIGTETQAGLTDTEDWDGVTGVHNLKMILTDAFYTTGHDYSIVLKAATIDAQVVNSVLATFSIENRVVAEVTGAVGSVTAMVTSNAIQISGDAAAANNLELACDNYSVTRGLTGTALPAVAADAAGGVPISDAGGLDLDIALKQGLFNGGCVYCDPTGTNSTAWPYDSPTYPKIGRAHV